MVIAVDFDGTIVEHEYPAIGRPIPFAIETLLQLQKDNHKLILWTVREGNCCRMPWITVQKGDSIFTPRMPISRVRTERKPPGSWEPIFYRRPKSGRLAGLGCDLQRSECHREQRESFADHGRLVGNAGTEEEKRIVREKISSRIIFKNRNCNRY